MKITDTRGPVKIGDIVSFRSGDPEMAKQEYKVTSFEGNTALGTLLPNSTVMENLFQVGSYGNHVEGGIITKHIRNGQNMLKIQT